MRAETDRIKLEQFMHALGQRSAGAGRIYLTGGSTAVLFGWREMTIDIDLKAEPEPPGFFEAIAVLKEALGINVELASPDQFIPDLPGWEDRSRFIARHGEIDFFHYDFHAQALAKIERGHGRDLADVAAMIERQLVIPGRLWTLFLEIEPRLMQYPAIEAITFRAAVSAVCRAAGEPGGA